MHKTPSWDDLQFVLALQKQQKLSAAARVLGVRHTTVARRIRSLEEGLGAKVFDRQSGGYRLTEVGEALYRAAESMETTAIRAFHELENSDRKPEGVVNLTMTESNAAFVVFPELERFRKQFPEISLQFKITDESLDLNRGEADIALRGELPTQPNLVARQVGHWVFLPYASKGYLSKHGTPATRGDWPKHRFIAPHEDLPLFDDPGHWLTRLMEKEARNSLRLSSVISMIEACRCGLGVAVLPKVCADRVSDLVCLSSSEVSRRPAYLVYRKTQKDSAKIQATLDFLKSLFSTRLR